MPSPRPWRRSTAKPPAEKPPHQPVIERLDSAAAVSGKGPDSENKPVVIALKAEALGVLGEDISTEKLSKVLSAYFGSSEAADQEAARQSEVT